MESLLPRGGFQLPFQRRLSRLYNDTKKSSDFVKDPVQSEEDPEVKALHRRLRIQKDRLVSWGLEWSDPNQSAEIDESLSKAGLSEVVGSIMSTIKDILAEAEPLWLSSKRVVQGTRPSPDHKAPLIQWDKGRFEDLIRDLTVSIDTLYDLSRTRNSGGVPQPTSKTPYKNASAPADDFRPFESTRFQTPQQIDPNTLTHLRPKQQDDGEALAREVVFMSKTAYWELTQTQGTTTREPWAPLLLEYATFDSIYAATGIMPPMAKFEKLCAGLQQDPQRAPGTWTGLPRLLGYFEDMENSRLGLVYRFPPSFNAVSFQHLSQNPLYSLPTLEDLLSRPESEPPLEAKFRLAYNLANTVFDMHARGIAHGGLVDRNLSFCDIPAASSETSQSVTDVRRPLISSFDVFTEDGSAPSQTLWRHPRDPRSTSQTPLPSGTDGRVLELYSLSMLLLSIGLWTKLDRLAPGAEACIPVSALDSLAVSCGSLYMKAVQTCWEAVEGEFAGESKGEFLLSSVQMKVSRFLETCCIIDGVRGLEERLKDEIENAEQQQAQPLKDERLIQAKVASKQQRDAKEMEKDSAVSAGYDEHATTAAPKSESKMRLYPHIPLAPEMVEKWNSILMPQINQALRHFYRKHPESVEISLESIGTSPMTTQPTVLVVCSSVGKVRAILKKRIGDLFDGTTGFALKVCRGHVTRSRRGAQAVTRSMALPKLSSEDDDEVEAVNPEYQECPGNGASIGAWIGDRHLPPVSFGGLLVVDNKTYGMTVHHMLDDPDRDFGPVDNTRSSAMPSRDWDAESLGSNSADDDFAYDLSDTESEPYSETDITSEYGDESDEDGDFEEPGDIPGIEPGCGDGYVVTQPALDDVEEGFYPCAETEDEDHLDTFSLGEVYASSGIRRKEADGLIHEVDWALFEFNHGRVPDNNSLPQVDEKTVLGRCRPSKSGDSSPLRPTAVAPSASLPGTYVQCVARTSGLQVGKIMPALTSVKIYGRMSPSHTYQVASVPSPDDGKSNRKPSRPMGIPGDSGAWVVDRRLGHLCGHVLAWSQRKQVAYICPMDVMLLDIAQTLEAAEVKLPGGEPMVTMVKESPMKQTSAYLSDGANGDEQDDDDDDDEEDTPSNTQELPNAKAVAASIPRSSSSRSISDHGSSSPIRMETSGELRGLSSRLEDMNIKAGQNIGVSA